VWWGGCVCVFCVQSSEFRLWNKLFVCVDWCSDFRYPNPDTRSSVIRDIRRSPHLGSSKQLSVCASASSFELMEKICQTLLHFFFPSLNIIMRGWRKWERKMATVFLFVCLRTMFWKTWVNDNYMFQIDIYTWVNDSWYPSWKIMELHKWYPLKTKGSLHNHSPLKWHP